MTNMLFELNSSWFLGVSQTVWIAHKSHQGRMNDGNKWWPKNWEPTFKKLALIFFIAKRKREQAVVWRQEYKEGRPLLVGSFNRQILKSCCICKQPFPRARGIVFSVASKVVMWKSRMNQSRCKSSVLVAVAVNMVKPSWGIEPERVQVACTCNRFSRSWSRMGSLGRDDQPHHSCSTFGLGYSHLRLLDRAKDCQGETYGTCDRIHHKSSRFVHLVDRRIHHYHHHSHLGFHRIRRHHIHQQPQGSCGRCGQP